MAGFGRVDWSAWVLGVCSGSGNSCTATLHHTVWRRNFLSPAQFGSSYISSESRPVLRSRYRNRQIFQAFHNRLKISDSGTPVHLKPKSNLQSLASKCLSPEGEYSGLRARRAVNMAWIRGLTE